MWRNLKSKSRSLKTRISANRWRLVVAVVFLFAGSLIYRLFNLQIEQCDLYTAMAANQQQVSSKLTPERGNIYFTGNNNGQETLYPAATNKEFAVLSAIPKDIVNPADLAEKFYEFFDEPQLQAALVAPATSSVSVAGATGTPALIATSTKDKLIAGYLKHFDRPGAVYDSLDNRKIDDVGLLKLYAFLASSTSTPVTADDLELKNNFVFYKNATSTAPLNIPGLDFRLEDRRYYPENNMGSQLLGFVSYADGSGQGHYGLEEFFNSEYSWPFKTKSISPTAACCSGRRVSKTPALGLPAHCL